MCLGSSPKVTMPKPPKLPDPIPAPAPPTKQTVEAPRMVQPMGSTPDIRIGSQKKAGSRNRNQTGQNLKGSLSISNNKGLNV